jgi:predicted amidohydrolase
MVSAGEKANLEDNPVVKVAAISFIPEKWDKENNLKRIESYVRQAASEGARIVVTPEGIVEGYLINDVLRSEQRAELEKKFFDIAEPVDGPAVTRIRELAKELSVDIILGFLERDEETLYNSCAYIDAEGEIVHVHRKTQMAQEYFEPHFYHPGWEIKAFDTGHGRFGMMICFERQIPEVGSALAMDGAKVLFNPSYGSRGEWNTTMLRGRARENGAYLLFVHPEQALIINPKGEVLVDKNPFEGVAYADLNLSKAKFPHGKQRRPEAFAPVVSRWHEKSNKRWAQTGRIRVAAVQMYAGHDMDENVEEICGHLEDCARQGVRVVVFPECVTTGYFRDEIPEYSQEQLLAAEKKIAQACRRFRVYAVIGTPHYKNGKMYNTALIIDDQGEAIYRQAKLMLVKGDNWAVPGDSMAVFHVDDIPCSVLICHDSRYPELVRLPVLAGARLVFYISWESDVSSERKVIPYRAQVVARAVENDVYIVQVNAPQSYEPFEGSHGQSRIVDYDGVILQEAPIADDAVLIEDLDITKARAGYPHRTWRDEYMLKDWYQQGVKRIKVIPPKSREEE